MIFNLIAGIKNILNSFRAMFKIIIHAMLSLLVGTLFNLLVGIKNKLNSFYTKLQIKNCASYFLNKKIISIIFSRPLSLLCVSFRGFLPCARSGGGGASHRL
jgi:hypothetical protein